MTQADGEAIWHRLPFNPCPTSRWRPIVPTVPSTPKSPFVTEQRQLPKWPTRGDLNRAGATVSIDAEDIHALYTSLIRLCYLPPLAEKTLPYSLGLHNLVGRLGRLWARRRLKTESRH